MNRIVSAAALTAIILLFSLPLPAQQCNSDWKEKFMSEKIAFLTTETGLTPQEAQSFWPVYNQVSKDRWETRGKVMDAYRKLEEGTKAGKPAHELSALLDSYLDAIEAMNRTDIEAAAKYRQALPADKVAKLYVAEEKFRRMQIHKLHHQQQGKK